MFEFELFEISKIDALRLVHLCVCLFGALSFIIIWFNVKKGDKKLLDQDLSLIFVGFALLLWSCMDAYRVMGLMKAGQVSLVIKTFSAYNNAFFIAALPFFRSAPESYLYQLPFFRNRTNWVISVLLLNVFIVLFYSLSWGQEIDHSNIIKYFDVFYSILTFGLLGYVIILSFSQINKYRHAFLLISILITATLIMPQLAFLPVFKIVHFDIISLIMLISHFILIFLLLVLGLSNIEEESRGEYLQENTGLNAQLSAFRFKNEELIHQLEIKTAEMDTLKLQLIDSQSELSENRFTIQKEHSLKDLSEREVDVLRLINKSYKEIGETLFIARETVISHKKNIETKLGISGKENLTEFAILHDLLESN